MTNGKRFFLCVTFLLSISTQKVKTQKDNTKVMQQVKNKIFLNYDKDIRPMINGSNTTEVYLTFIPRQIIGIDEETSIFSLESLLYMRWKDSRLKWDTSEYNGFLQLPSNYIWVPDVTIYNSHSAAMDPLKNVLVALDSDGEMYWYPPLLTETLCTTVAAPYPGDELECSIQLGSWAYEDWEIDFKHIWVWKDPFINIHPRWEAILDKVHAERNITVHECCEEPFISLNIHFPMRRRADPAIETTRIPCLLVMILNLAIFWFPSDSSKKILLGAFLLLVLIVLFTYVAWTVKNPLIILFSVSFLQTTMYLAVITIFLQVIIVTKVARFMGPSRPHPTLIKYLTGPLGKYLCLRSPVSEDTQSLDRMQLKEDSSTVECLSVSDEWKLTAAAIDRVLFITMAVTMIAVHHL